MDQSFSLAGARPVAKHCSELIGTRSKEPERLSCLTLVGRRLSVILPQLFAPVCDEVRYVVQAEPVTKGDPDDVLGDFDAPMSHVVISAGLHSDDLMISIEARSAYELLDRVFGGDGKVSGELPATMPGSVQTMLGRIEDVMMSSISKVAPDDSLQQFAKGRRSDDLGVLRAFNEEDIVYVLAVKIACGDNHPWSVRISMRQQVVDLLNDATPRLPAPGHSSVLTPADKPFCDIPLKLKATIVDMRVPLSRLEGLKIGDVIPVALARQVPLSVGDKVIALGTVGELDDRVALQITRAF